MARKVLASRPFRQLLGTELTVFEEGLAELRLTLKPEYLQQHGFVHGGIVGYLADNAMTYAGGSVLGNVLTQKIKVNYTRSAVGEVLIARATVVSFGKSQAVCRCDISSVSDGKEKLCAAAQGTIVPMPARP